jgi:hypothetical protein
MNERITQFYEQCNQVVDDPFGGAHISFDHQMFAQLIVRECSDWIVDNAGAMEHLGPEYFVKAMQKHFGVAE